MRVKINLQRNTATSLLKVKILPVLMLPLLFMFTGCFEKEISCNHESIKDIVKEITQDELALEITCLQRVEENGNDMAPIMVQGVLNMCKVMLNMGSFMKNDGLDELHRIHADIQEQVSNGIFELTDIRTIKKDKELSRVECKATLGVTLSKNKKYYSREIEYTAQFSDNKEKIYVEIVNND